MFKTKTAAPRVLQGLCRVTMHASSAQHDQELTPGHTNKVNHSHWPKALMHKSFAHRYFASRSSHRLVEIYIYSSPKGAPHWHPALVLLQILDSYAFSIFFSSWAIPFRLSSVLLLSRTWGWIESKQNKLLGLAGSTQSKCHLV